MCSAMMVELWTRKRAIGEQDDNDGEDTSGYEKSGVRTSRLGWEDLVSENVHAGSVLLPAVLGIAN